MVLVYAESINKKGGTETNRPARHADVRNSNKTDILLMFGH